ncbi:unnamed protein product [Effrenium voratum]|uniref:EF-hand domain-containing protein n=1 Tax=Effrenium voratum TaxID=2562239 RepID=A0AA36JRA9_9DINO|nr:unnamed protein product [Effrenium voratum]CAJ1410277.1 unnamed protein product [Effrenium voratum]CAJ1439076.1 unnamed protein product [Effrenium voratum]
MSGESFGPSPRFQDILSELVAAHVEEVAKLREQIEKMQHEDKSLAPLPPPAQLSPPLPPVEALPKAQEARMTISKGLSSLDLVDSEEPSEDSEADMHWLRAFFLGSHFEMCVAMLLFINICLMAAQLQYLGLTIGHNIGYANYNYAAEEAWPNADMAFFVGDLSFATIFSIEILIRQYYLGLRFFKFALNWVDFLVVCSSWAEIFAAALPINPTFLRMLRLGKLLRAIRVVRMSQVLDSLQLLLKCIAASVKILFWSLFLLMIIQISAGMSISYMVSEYLVDETAPTEARFAVFRYYGTFTKTLLTMFEVLFANWAPPCRVLIDNVSEWYSLVFIIYRCFVGFAVLNVVNAVFVQSTMKVAQADDDFIAREKRKAEESYHRKVTSLFRQVDTSGDGKIDVREFKRLLRAPKLQVWLSQLDIETTDLWGLFKMLDQGDGEISLEEFEAGTMRIKGLARSFDLAQLQSMIQRLSAKVDCLLRREDNVPHVGQSAPSPTSSISPDYSQSFVFS